MATENQKPLNLATVEAFVVIGKALEKANEEIMRHREKQAAAQALMPDLVQVLKNSNLGLVITGEEKSASDFLSDPVQALIFLKEAVSQATAKMAQIQSGELPATAVKTASAIDGARNSDGSRRHASDPECDRILFGQN